MLRILLKKGTNLIVFMVNTNVDCRSFMLTRNIWCWTPDSKVKVSTSIYGGIGTPLYFLRVSSRVFAPLTVSANGCSMKTNLHQFPRRLRWGLRCRPNSLQGLLQTKQLFPTTFFGVSAIHEARIWIACSAGVFFGRANVLLAKAPCWNSKRQEKMGRVKRRGVGGVERGEKAPARKHCENEKHPRCSGNE